MSQLNWAAFVFMIVVYAGQVGRPLGVCVAVSAGDAINFTVNEGYDEEDDYSYKSGALAWKPDLSGRGLWWVVLSVRADRS